MIKLNVVKVLAQVDQASLVWDVLGVSSSVFLRGLLDNKLRVSEHCHLRISMSRANLKPRMHASYSETLLVASKVSLQQDGKCIPSLDMTTAPTPAPLLLDAPSKYIRHPSKSSPSFLPVANRTASFGKAVFIGS